MDICTGKTNREKLLYLEDNLCLTRLIIIIQISVLANRLPLLAFNDICMKTKLGAGLVETPPWEQLIRQRVDAR